MTMFVCTDCSSFVPPAARACPACGRSVTPTARVVGGVLTLAGGSLFAMTLSACYGMTEPPRDYDDAGPRSDAHSLTCSDPATDLDGDGHCGSFDCDEADPDIHSGAEDTPGDGVDSNCDGVN